MTPCQCLFSNNSFHPSKFQVETPSGMARTHRFATETVDLPAQEGERVTIAVAAPSKVYREVGPFKFRSEEHTV